MARYILGAISLTMAVACFLMFVPAAISLGITKTGLPPAFVLLFVALGSFFTVIGAFLWVRSVQRAPGDDIFSDQRGLLVSLMLATVLLLGAATLWLALHPDFWSGMMQGMGEARR